jgi:hypothetical protein
MKRSRLRTLIVAGFAGLALTGAAQTFKITADVSKEALSVNSKDGKANITGYAPTEVKTISQSLTNALKAWDKENNGSWTVQMAKDPFDGLITVAQYTPSISLAKGEYTGKMNVTFNYTPGKSGLPVPIQGGKEVGDPPSLSSTTNLNGKAVWIQSVSTFIGLNGTAPLHMDTLNAAADAFPGPFFAYQYNGSAFKDTAERMPNEWTIFQAYLVVPTYATDTLTVYDGVQWGYQVTLAGKDGPGENWGGNPPHVITPGPEAAIPFALSLTALWRRRRRISRSF